MLPLISWHALLHSSKIKAVTDLLLTLEKLNVFEAKLKFANLFFLFSMPHIRNFSLPEKEVWSKPPRLLSTPAATSRQFSPSPTSSLRMQSDVSNVQRKDVCSCDGIYLGLYVRLYQKCNIATNCFCYSSLPTQANTIFNLFCRTWCTHYGHAKHITQEAIFYIGPINKKLKCCCDWWIYLNWYTLLEMIFAFASYINTDMPQVVEIMSHGWQQYDCPSQSMALMLMT